MLENLSKKIALWLIKSGILKETDIDLYGYAIQYLLLIIIPTINFTAYCIATHNILNGLITIFSFLLIRKYSGGYHCQSSLVCLIFSTIVLILMTWISNFIKFSLLLIVILIISETELLIKGPICSVSHSISAKEKNIYHKYMYIIILFYNLLISLFFYLNLRCYANCIIVSILSDSFAHVICLYGNNKELYY